MTIEPIQQPRNPKKMVALAAWIIVATLFIIFTAPRFFDTVMTRLENQKEARAAYMYKTYGDLYTK